MGAKSFAGPVFARRVLSGQCDGESALFGACEIRGGCCAGAAVECELDSMGVGERSQYHLVILGKYVPKSALVVQGETLGHSFFGWDVDTKQGTSYRANRFMQALGYEFQLPTDEQLDYAHSLEKKMAVWPEKDGMIVVDNLIVIKLSE